VATRRTKRIRRQPSVLWCPAPSAPYREWLGADARFVLAGTLLDS